MKVLVVGPYVLSGDRLAIAAAVITFTVVSAALAFALDRAINRWAGYAIVAGLVSARVGFAIEHPDHFLQDPMGIFKFWQGGLRMGWGLGAMLLVSIPYIRNTRVITACMTSLMVSANAWLFVHNFATTAAAQALPSQNFQQLHGEPITLSKTGGRVAVINVWATWCPPCRHELPMFARAAELRKDVAFFFVNAGEDEEVVRNFLKSEGLSLSHVLLDREKTVSEYFGIPGYPATLFVRSDGTVAITQIGEVTSADLYSFIAEASRR